MNKKGQGISMTYIVIAALALVVLVVIILFFTGGLQTLFQSQKGYVDDASDQQKEIWRETCKLYCSLDQTENFCHHEFKHKVDGEVKEIYVCNTGKTLVATSDIKSLDIDCKTIDNKCNK